MNSLLDFARIEAGRVTASFEPVDLAALTADLASNFRSAMDRAGLEFKVRLRAARHAGARGSGDVGEGRPEPAFERIQVHARRRHRRAASREPAMRCSRWRTREWALPRTSCRACSNDFIASRARRLAPTKALASASRWCMELVKLHGGSDRSRKRARPWQHFPCAYSAGIGTSAGRAIRARPKQVRLLSVGNRLAGLRRRKPCAGCRTTKVAGARNAGAPADRIEDLRFASTFGSRIVLADDNADMRGYVRRVVRPECTSSRRWPTAGRRWKRRAAMPPDADHLRRHDAAARRPRAAAGAARRRPAARRTA